MIVDLRKNIGSVVLRMSGVPEIEKGIDRLNNNYYLNNCKAIYGKYMDDGMAMSPEYSKNLERNRKYSNGWIDIEAIRPSGDRTVGDPRWSTWSSGMSRTAVQRMRDGWTSVDFTNHVSPAPKILSLLRDQILSIDQSVIAEVCDPVSRDEELDKKWQAKVNADFLDLQKKVADFTGQPMDDSLIVPESNEELEMIAKSGGFKHRFATASQNFIKSILEVSRYKQDRQLWVDDILNGKYVCAITTIDPVTNYLQVEYVDPIQCSIQYSRYYDHRDSEYGFVWKDRHASELLTYGFTREDIATMAKAYSGVNGNPIITSDSVGLEESLGTKVQEARCFWIDTYNGIRRVYEATYIIGTDFVYNVGISQHQGRYNANRDVLLPLVVIRTTDEPIMSRMKEFIDLFYIGIKKLELGIKMSRPNGQAINLHMLNNSSAGLKDKPIDVLKSFADTRILPFMQSITGAYQGGSVSPITPIDGGVGSIIENAVLIIQQAIANIYEVTGLNPQLFSALLNVGSRTATEANLQAQQTIAVMRPLIAMQQDLKERVATTVASRLRTQAKNAELFRQTYKYIAAPADIEAMILGATRDGEVRLTMVVMPTDKFKEEFKAQVYQLQSVGAIYPEDGMYIIEKLNQDVDLGEIRNYIAYKMSRKRKEDEQAKINIMKSQAQAQGEAQQGAMAAEIQKVQQEGQIKGTVEAMKSDAQTQGALAVQKEKNIGELQRILADMYSKMNNEQALTSMLNG